MRLLISTILVKLGTHNEDHTPNKVKHCQTLNPMHSVEWVHRGMETKTIECFITVMHVSQAMTRCDFSLFPMAILTKFDGIALKARGGPRAIITASTQLCLRLRADTFGRIKCSYKSLPVYWLAYCCVSLFFIISRHIHRIVFTLAVIKNRDGKVTVIIVLLVQEVWCIPRFETGHK